MSRLNKENLVVVVTLPLKVKESELQNVFKLDVVFTIGQLLKT